MGQTRRRAGWALALVPLVLVLAGCSSGGGGSGAGHDQSATATLKSAGGTVQSAMKSYLRAWAAAPSSRAPSCASRQQIAQLGEQDPHLRQRAGHRPRVHRATGGPDHHANEAQTLANSLEILGDAQPTQANYNQVLNTFNVNSAITQLQGDVTRLAGSLGSDRLARAQSGTSASSP